MLTQNTAPEMKEMGFLGQTHEFGRQEGSEGAVITNMPVVHGNDVKSYTVELPRNHNKGQW
jgi:hypothetical protein